MKVYKGKGTKFIITMPKDCKPITFLGMDKENIMQVSDGERVYDIKKESVK